MAKKNGNKKRSNKAAARSGPTSPVDENASAANDALDSIGQELEIPSSTDDGSVPTSAAVTANEEPIVPTSPPPPPPPPPAPVSTPSTFKGGIRVVRRQSTSAASQATANAGNNIYAGVHARSATDPSSSTPNLSRSRTGISDTARPSSPAAELASALKRNNTIGSFSPSSLKKTITGNGAGNASIANVIANGNVNASTNTNASDNLDANENGKERRTSSPPPVKPKPPSLFLNRGLNQKKISHERSSSVLLKTALVQGASAAVNGKSPAPETPAPPSKLDREREEPERRSSVQEMARLLEGNIQLTSPSPGTPPTWRNRSSVASNKSLKSVRSIKREEEEYGESLSDEGAVVAEDCAIKENGKVDREVIDKGEVEKRERMSAVVASLTRHGIIRPATPEKTISSVYVSAEDISTNVAVTSTLPSVPATPSPPLTPPLSPPSVAKTPTKVVPVPPGLPTPPQEPTDTTKMTPVPPSAQNAPAVPPTDPKTEEEGGETPTSPTPKSSSSTDETIPDSSKSEVAVTSSVPSSSSSSRLSKRASMPPPNRPPPPPPADSGVENVGDSEEQKSPENSDEDTIPLVSVREPTLAGPEESKSTPARVSSPPPALKPKSARRYSVPPPSRPPPPQPIEEGGEEEGRKVPPRITEEAEEEDEIERQAKATALTDDEEHVDNVVKVVLGNVLVQEPEAIGEQDVQMRTGEEEYDSADDDLSSDDEMHESFKSALSRNGSSSLPPTPPTKHDASFPINLTSKWSRNTSAVPSANASTSTLALQDHLQTHVELREQLEVESDGSQVDEGTTLAHVNPNDLNDSNDANDTKDNNVNKTIKVEEDPMDSRFKFPPVSAFPPPPPLPTKRSTGHNINRTMRVFGVPNESESSLASVHEVDDEESADEADRDTVVVSDVLRFKKKSKTKAKLTTAIAAALAKTPPPALSDDQGADDPTIMERTESESTASRSSTDETDPVFRAARTARYRKIDEQEKSFPRPAPFPTIGDGGHGQSQSAPEVPSTRRPTGSGEDRRTVRLSSKLLPITGPQRMNTSPTASYSTWGKSKAVMSSETLQTIGTIATEPGDLDMSQFGTLSGAAAGAPPSSFLSRVMSDTSKTSRPPARRQTTSMSQASRFVEDLPIPFFKRSASPPPISTTSTHERAATISFSSRMRTMSIGQATITGPPTRKNSLIPELRAATIEAAERPMSAVSEDFVLIEEPEEFDIPRAEWDLPRIPSGSLRMPSTMDLKIRAREDLANGNINGNGKGKSGPSSAPARTAPVVPVAPTMQHSRSATTGTSGSSGTASTTKTSASAPAGPAAISFQHSTGSEHTMANGRLSSDALLDLWGRVGVYISDAAALLHDKSRRMLVGDGTYPGFVLAVARQVPTACIPSRSARYPYGHLIYFQTAATVHKRTAEILPGDVIVLQNALFKGVRGPLHQSYQEELGTKGDPVVGVIGEFEARKSKVKAYQANQHVGIQTVEYVSYRFNDLKSGTIKIFRVPDS